MIKISIIIPIYNVNSDYIRECIESIRTQTYSNFEVILVDDGSSYECARYIDACVCEDDRMKCIHKKNEGVSVSRNIGAMEASGDYILYVDADDILTPWCLETGVRLIENTSADIVIGKIANITERKMFVHHTRNGEAFKIFENHADRTELLVNILTKEQPSFIHSSEDTLFNFEGCWARFVKKDVMIGNPFVAGLAIGEDTVWNIQLFKNKDLKICITESLWYYYIQNPGSVMNQYKENLPELLSEPVAYISKLVEQDNKKVYIAYKRWILTKLKQIIYRTFLASECDLSWQEKKRKMRKILDSEPWARILNQSIKTDFQTDIRFILHRNNLMIDILSLKKKITSMRKKVVDLCNYQQES